MSLTDLLVALAVLGLLLAGTVTLLEQGQQAHAIGSARAESQQGARAALARLAAELRQAGFGPTDLPAISVAEPSRVVLHLDADGNGVVAGTSETIAWFLAGSVLRRSAGAGAQPVLGGVSELAFEYLDEAGHPVSLPGAIRVVGVRLTSQPLRPYVGPARSISTSVSTRVRLRNR